MENPDTVYLELQSRLLIHKAWHGKGFSEIEYRETVNGSTTAPVPCKGQLAILYPKDKWHIKLPLDWTTQHYPIKNHTSQEYITSAIPHRNTFPLSRHCKEDTLLFFF